MKRRPSPVLSPLVWPWGSALSLGCIPMRLLSVEPAGLWLTVKTSSSGPAWQDTRVGLQFPHRDSPHSAQGPAPTSALQTAELNKQGRGVNQASHLKPPPTPAGRQRTCEE